MATMPESCERGAIMVASTRLWAPLVVGLLVAGALGIGGSGAAAVEPRVTAGSIMIPASAFIPATGGLDYYNLGSDLHVHGAGEFYAPLWFPAPVVDIKKVTIYAYDNQAAAQVCVTLWRTRPAGPNFLDNAGQVCTGDSTALPQVRYLTAIAPRRVNTAQQGSYLEVDFSGSEVFLGGVRVSYSYTTP